MESWEVKPRQWKLPLSGVGGANTSVFVAGDFDLLEDAFATGAVQSNGTQVDEYQVVVGAASNDAVALVLQAAAQLLRVLHHLAIINKGPCYKDET